MNIDNFDKSKYFIKDLADIELIDSVPCGILIASADPDFTITHANKGYFDLVGYNKEEIYDLFSNKGVLTLHPEEIQAATLSFNEQVQANANQSFSIKTRLVNKTHGYKWVHFSGRLTLDNNEETKIYILLVDITEYLFFMDQLKSEQEYNKLLLELANDSFFDLDIATQKFSHSRKFAKKFNIPLNRDSYITDFIKAGIICDESIADFLQIIDYATVQGVDKGNGMTVKLKTSAGENVWYMVHYKIIFEKDGKPVRIVGKLSDVTEQQNQIERLTRKAETDSLTKLFNKGETRQRIEDSLSNSPEDCNALIIADIDNFKGVNDNLGHQFGDAVLIEISSKIKKLFRDSDIVGRVGGDEFMVFMHNIKNEEVLYDKAEELCEAFRHTFTGQNNEYKISGSIGIAINPRHGKTFQELYEVADIALYESKRKGKDCFTLYYDGINDGTMKNHEPIQEAERFMANYFTDDSFYDIFEMLYETKDLNATISMILNMIGKKFDVSRCYIFEHSIDGKTTSNTYEWCAQGTESVRHTLQNIPTSEMEHFFSAFNRDGVFYCNNLSTLDDFSRQSLTQQGIKSFLHCGIYDNGVMKGFIGFDDCRRERVWKGEEIATLSYISRILSAFIIKRQISRDVLEPYKNYKTILDNLRGYVFVIDKETLRFLYLNKLMAELGFVVGQGCDEAWQHIPESLKQLKEFVSNTVSGISTLPADNPANASATIIKWADNRDAVLICCTDIA